MRNGAVRRDREDRKGRERPKNADQRLWLHATFHGQLVQRPIAVGWDAIGNAKVSDETEHARDLKSSQQEIEGGACISIVLRIWHEVTWLPFEVVTGFLAVIGSVGGKSILRLTRSAAACTRAET